MQNIFPALSGIALAVALASPALAQDTLRVPVDGHEMRVQLDGQERMGMLPLVIFESGGGGWSVEGWRPVFTDIAKVAPVLAYDRAGYGQSAPDGQPPTPRHNR